MKRILWLSVGAAIGVVVFRKVNEAKGAIGPEGLNRAVGRLADSVYHFADQVRDGMREREDELRAALALDDRQR
ncbi:MULTISPECIES: DUF6167 family protein [Arthrobacter]|uniref:DUF6167 family protein n=2 Tax=Arthrobacter TaxID=1663 RepID=A0ABU9KGN4_9MICC|nr:DUF6167 family protein [Arthrobacter sp. YJM1]MDP5226061.1 DUF6167 family protein [Arthrobacter sp. YJM1]